MQGHQKPLCTWYQHLSLCVCVCTHTAHFQKFQYLIQWFRSPSKAKSTRALWSYSLLTHITQVRTYIYLCFLALEFPLCHPIGVNDLQRSNAQENETSKTNNSQHGTARKFTVLLLNTGIRLFAATPLSGETMICKMNSQTWLAFATILWFEWGSQSTASHLLKNIK